MRRRARDIFDVEISDTQLAATLALLRGLDVMVLLRTGGGKSLIYQLVTCLVRDIDVTSRCLVVSPLLALIEDQVSGLTRRLAIDETTHRLVSRSSGVSASHSYPVASRLHPFVGDRVPFLFTTPEALTKRSNAELAALRLSLVVVDEAHCVSTHGLSFRSSYRGLSRLRDIWRDVPICALTATAPPPIRRDVVEHLSLRTRGSFLLLTSESDRPNLSLSVRSKRGACEDLAWMVGEVRRVLALDELSQILIYVATRAATLKVAELLNERLGKTTEVVAYHAGLSPRSKAEVLRGFSSRAARCVVATIAFGMGMDSSSVRAVVHYGLPASLDGYVQEIGRAGRDGSVASCTLLWGPEDVARRNFASSTSPKVAEKRTMLGYVQETRCLRAHLSKFLDGAGAKMHYADEEVCSERGGERCSLCLGSVDLQVLDMAALSERALRLLDTVAILTAGSRRQLLYHVGSRSQKSLQDRDRLGGRQYGSGSDLPLSDWQVIHRQLQSLGLVTCNSFGASVLSASGRRLVEERRVEAKKGSVTDPLRSLSDDSRSKSREKIRKAASKGPLAGKGAECM